MKTLKLLMATTAVVMMTFAAEAAKTAKAVLADSGKTLKFVYDETDYGTKDKDWFSVAEAEALDPSLSVPWAYEKFARVEFDPSFAQYKPKQCCNWFADAKELTEISGLRNLDVSEVANFSWMFANCSGLTTLDLSGFDMKNATHCYHMFAGCGNLRTIYALDKFVLGAGAGAEMFKGCTSLVGGKGTEYDATAIDATYARIDGGTSAPGYFSPPPVAKVVVEDGGATLRFVYDNKNYGMKYTDWFAVADAEAITKKGSAPWCGYCETVTKVIFDESFAKYRPTKCFSWFYGFGKLETIENIGNLDTSAVNNFGYMFGRCSSLASLDVTGFDTSSAEYMDGMFARCSSLKSLAVTGFDTSKVTDMLDMFTSCSSLASLDVTRFNTSRVTVMSYMFNGCSSLKSLDVTGFDTSKVRSMNYMFSGCSLLETIIASDGFATTAVVYSEKMFSGCTALVGGNGTKYDGTKMDKEYARIDGGPSAPGYFTAPLTAKVVVEDGGATLRFVYDNKNYGTKGTDWFSVAEAEAINPANNPPWYDKRDNVTKVVFADSFKDYRPKHCGSWFFKFENLATIENIWNLDTSAATSLTYMFGNCWSLTSLDVTGFDTATVTNMKCLFSNCSSLTKLDLSGFDTANVTDMCYMFYGCSSLTALDVTGFDTAKVTNMYEMFFGCSSLASIAASDKFVTTAVTISNSMFKDCTALKGGNGTAYDSAKTDATYARIDGKDGHPGYFTDIADVYKVKFVAGKGTGTMADLICARDKVYNLTKCTFTAPTGKSFKGWACSNNRRYDDGMLVFNLAEPGETVTMTAIWE